jgi:NAD(P)-dependent dehydrogenase (short-subunit alcohol dehydrogenase family)
MAKGRLEGKVAIVTGAGSQGEGVGTGKAISILFAREGAAVTLVDLVPERAEETRETIVAEGGSAIVVAADVSSGADCARVVQETVDHWGAVHILVNNVGIVPRPGRVHELDEAVWDKVIAVDLTGAMLMSKHALGPMMAAGTGSVVNISSTGAFQSTGDTPAYGAAKAGLLRLTADIAVGYGRDNVRANAIAPGQIFTPLASGGDERSQQERGLIAPMGTRGDAWDVAWAAVYLASDEARWVTGVCLPVDGGLLQVSPLKAHRTVNALLGDAGDQ